MMSIVALAIHRPPNIRLSQEQTQQGVVGIDIEGLQKIVWEASMSARMRCKLKWLIRTDGTLIALSNQQNFTVYGVQHRTFLLRSDRGGSACAHLGH